jgi:DNA repair exonuclease SbcCD ATPase subunit
MKLTRVQWRNFASYGNKLQNLEFNENESNLFLVLGENGAGKSTISDVITFGIYGKIEGKKQKDIANRVNGNAWARIDFTQDSKEYAIERGLDPNVFSFYEDGVLYDKAGVKNVQEYLEEIIGIPYYVFTNTLSLSINDFKSYLKMSPADKKGIFDKIFGLSYINEMRDKVKDDIKGYEKDSLYIGDEIKKFSQVLSQNEWELTRVSESNDDRQKVELESLQEDLKKFQDLKKLHDGRKKDFKIKYDQYIFKRKEIESDVATEDSNIRVCTGKIDLYSKGKCPTCESPFDSEFHQNLKKDLEEQKTKAQENAKVLAGKKKKLDEIEKILREENNDLQKKGGSIETKIEDIRRNIKNHQPILDQGLVSLQKIVENSRQDLSDANTRLDEVAKNKNFLTMISNEILGENGMKKEAIRAIMPDLNKNISEFMVALNLHDYSVEFDEFFDAKIYHLGEEISVSTLSTGEMKKVDFVVLLSILKSMKSRFNSMNLLFLDEIFSSVDGDGVYCILGALRNICDQLGLNTFVINHAQMPTAIFDYCIKISKKSNFSEMEIEKV